MPLFMAAKGRKVGAVRALIEAGAEVDAECGAGMVRLHIFIPHTGNRRFFFAVVCFWGLVRVTDAYVKGLGGRQMAIEHHNKTDSLELNSCTA